MSEAHTNRPGSVPYESLMGRLADLAEQIQDMRTELRDYSSSETAARQAVNDRVSKALNGGNGEGEGIYERLRQLAAWKADHTTTHGNLSVERRSSEQDWRRFWIGVADRTFTVLFAILGILIVFAVTGKVITLP